MFIDRSETLIRYVDIMPLRRGHTLVIPKVHISRLSELPPDIAASLGAAVSKVAQALTEGMFSGCLFERQASC